MAGQFLDQALAEQKLKELGLRHVGGQFEVIEPAFAKFVDHVGLVVFEHDQIHGLTSENGCGKGKGKTKLLKAAFAVLHAGGFEAVQERQHLPLEPQQLRAGLAEPPVGVGQFADVGEVLHGRA